MSTLLQDLRYALRMLRHDGGIALVATLSIALAIGANATIFTWLDGLVLHPLPAVPAVDRIAQLHTLGPGGVEWSVSYPDLQDWRTEAQSFTGIAGFDMVQASVRTTGQAQRAFGMLVSANYFDVLRVRPMLGRGFLPAEDSAAGAHPVALLSYSYWRRRFASDSNIVGSTALFNGRRFTIVGVTPPRFGGSFVGLSFDFWAPLSMDEVLGGRSGRLADRGNQWIEAFGRLKPGVTVDEARGEMRTIESRLARTYPDDRQLSATALGFGSAPPVVWFRPAFLALLGITGVVLLIACANVANLLLTRAAGRTKEMGIRLALGARRSRLVRQLLLESAVLAVGGGTLGLALAVWGKNLFGAFIPSAPIPVVLDLTVNGRVVVFTIAATTVTVLLFGLVPALRGSRPDLVPALKDEVMGRGMSRSKLRSGLVVAQVALSMIALVAAGLFARSLAYAQTLDRGFTDPAHVLLIGTDMQLAAYTPERALVFYNAMRERIAATPGVHGASLVANVPLGFGGHNSNGAVIEGYTPRVGENMSIQTNRIGPDYFRTMGTQILMGREVTPQDRAGAPTVAVVNQAFVDRYWPGQNALGRHITIGGGIVRTVVGVVATGKYAQLGEPPTPFVFMPLAQVYAGGVAFVVRTAVPALELLEPLRREFAAADPGVPFLDPQTLEDYTVAAVFVQRAVAWLLGAFGGLALVLAAMGIYSVTAYAVSQRTRELGIRSALGAGRGEIVALILRQGTLTTVIGLAIGLGAALAVAQLLRSQLLGVRPTDPLTLAFIVALLAGVALVASYLPARRAGSVDPMVALRHD